MRPLLLVAPLLIPLTTAILGAFGWGRARPQRALGIGGSALLLAAAVALFVEVREAGVIAVQLGSWPAPHGISLVADLLSASMILVSALIGFCVALHAGAETEDGALAHGFFPFFHVLLLGVCGAFLTGDLFNLYVWFEVMLLASFVLLASSGSARALRSSLPYVALNLLASVFFLIAAGLLYGELGSLHLADLALRLEEGGRREALAPVASLLLVAFGIKAGLFPVFFWLPASYPTPGFAVSALFAGLLTKVGVYAMLRVFTLLFPVEEIGLGPLLVGLSIATMATGVLAAASQGHLRRILSFHIVSQIGYMVLGLALATPLAIAAALFYVLHHIVTKTNLFLVSALIARRGGSETLSQIGVRSTAGLGLVVLFAIPALSLAGVPPFSGFFAKLFLLRASLETEAFVSAGVMLAVGLLTLFSMAKIWNEAFWKTHPESPDAPSPSLPALPVAASALLGLVTVGMGLGAEGVWSLAEAAAAQLLDPTDYVRAVLGEAS